MIFDIIFILLFVYTAYKGYTKGLIIMAASLAAWILGIYAAIHFSDFSAMQIVSRTEYDGNNLPLIAFIVTFFVIAIVVILIGKLIDKLVKTTALGFVNRIFGVIFGLIKTALFLSVILTILNSINVSKSFLPEEKVKDSYLYAPLSKLTPLIFPSLSFDIPKDYQIPDNEDTLET